MKFDLGVFVDSALNGDDNAYTEFTSDRRGIYTRDVVYKDYTSLVKGHYFKDVDTMYIGTWRFLNRYTPESFPFWENTTNNPTLQNSDTVYSFAWQQQEIAAWANVTLGYLAHPGNTVLMPPFVFDRTEKKEYYPGNTPILLKFEVVDYDVGEKITVKYNLNGTDEIEEFTTDKTKRSLVITKTVNLLDTMKYTYSIYAVDSTGYMSDVIEGTLMAEGAMIPNFFVDLGVLDSYDPTERIHVEGRVEDEFGVFIRYQFDEGPIFLDEHVDTTENGTQHFNTWISLSGKQLVPGSDYAFKMWAEDDFGQKSSPYTHKFHLKKAPAPTIYSAYLSDEKVQVKEEIIIYGEANDPDEGQNIDLYVTFGEREEEYLGSFVATKFIDPFAFFYKIPDVNIGRYNITLRAEDASGLKSTKSVTKVITVFDPNMPMPQPPLGNITVVPLKRNTNACFDLEYTSPEDSSKHGMSYQNEGFYVGYRLYKGNIPQQTKLVRSIDGQKSETDQVSVKFQHSYEPNTGYLQLLFNITNDGYFPQTIDLGVFVDAEFSENDDAPITLRDDGRGFIISDYEPDIKYTVFTRDFGTVPNVDTQYLYPVERESSEEIPLKDMPFWKNSDDYSASGNAMYSFAWKKRKILPGTWTEFGVILAGGDEIRTPPRIIDETNLEQYYIEGDEIELKIKVIDSDIGEKIQFLVNVMGEQEMKEFTITDKENNVVYTKSFIIGDIPYFRYTVIARDTSLYYLSNVINVTIPVSQMPQLYYDYSDWNQTIFVGDKIKLHGEVYDYDSDLTYIKYQFDDGRVETAGSFDTSNERFKFIIDIPEPIKPGMNHTLSIWAEDDSGVKDSEITVLQFTYLDRTLPVLLKAGLSHKIAQPGQKLLGFAAVDKVDVGKTFNIFIKFGDNEFEFVKQFTKTTEGLMPVAFHWSPPHGAISGTYSVEFKVINQYNLESEGRISKTLYIVE